MASTSSVTPSKARAPIFSNLLLSIEKLDGSNYSNRTSEVTLWISRLGYKSHLTSTIDSILVVDRAQWAKIDANLCSVIKSTLHPSLKSIFLPHMQMQLDMEMEQKKPPPPRMNIIKGTRMSMPMQPNNHHNLRCVGYLV